MTRGIVVPRPAGGRRSPGSPIRLSSPSRALARPGRSRVSDVLFYVDQPAFLLFVQGCLVFFFCLVLIRIPGGAADDDLSRKAQEVGENGDALRELLYFLLFGFSLLIFGLTQGLRIPKTISIFQILAVGWLLISFSWSAEPFIAFRRSILLTITMTVLATSVQVLGTRRVIQCLYISLAVAILASLISVPLFSFAIHPPTEADKSIVGCWRGLITHKNVAGGVAGMAIIVYLHYCINRGRWFDYVLLAASAIFLVGTRSKTSIGFLIPDIMVGIVFRQVWGGARARIYLLLGLSGGVLVAGLLSAVFADKIADVLNNPLSFTGRVVIWKTALAEVMDHPLVGAGYSTFWGIGRSSPLFKYITEPFLEFVMQSHDGYVETAVNGGFVGLGLCILASIIIPLKQLFRWDGANLPTRAMLLSILCFGITENFFEAQFYTKEKQIWIILSSAVFIVQLMTTERNSDTARLPERTRRPTIGGIRY